MREKIPATTAAVLHKAGVSNTDIAKWTGLRLAYINNLHLKARDKLNIDRAFYEKMLSVYSALSKDPVFAQKISELTKLANSQQSAVADHEIDEAAAPEGATPVPETESVQQKQDTTQARAKIEITPMELRVLRIAFQDWGASLDNRLAAIIAKLEKED